MFMKQFTVLGLGALSLICAAQPTAQTRPAAFHRLPGVSRLDKANAIDCNSPGNWFGKRFVLFNSYGQPYRGEGPDLYSIRTMAPARLQGTLDGRPLEDLFIWLESTWLDERGILYGWYHYEPDDVCRAGEHLPTAPRIGAIRSRDRGVTWEHLGVVIEAPPGSATCQTSSPWDAGGHGDFSVIADGERRHFYFFFSSYVKDPAQQGVAVARMAYADRDAPQGKVFKWHNGGWSQPGIGGDFSPIWPSRRDWHKPDADLFWGPSIHWNTYLRTYVILMSRAVTSSMAGDGTWISYNPRLDDPAGWSGPVQLLTATAARAATRGADDTNAARYGWYPQVIGTRRGESDKLAGKTARLFIAGVSNLEIVFSRQRRQR